MKNKNFSLKKEFLNSWKYLLESRKFIWFIVAVFFVFSLIGFFAPVPAEIEKQILDILKNLLEQTQGMSGIELSWFIFTNNLQASFFGLIFGIILGIFPFLISVSNGYLLGLVAKKSVEFDGIFSLWKIFPHGVFELPAVFISLGLGMKFGSILFQKKKLENFKTFFERGLKVFFFIVIPLLIIAALIEGILIVLVG